MVTGRSGGMLIEAIAASIREVAGVKLLDVDPGESTNRTVMTFVGAPEDVVEAAFRAAATAYRLIDMTKQEGEHPRLGAVDVVPFVPISGTPLEGHPAPSSAFMRQILDPLGDLLRQHGLRSKDIKAGCGKCGACSSLSVYEA